MSSLYERLSHLRGLSRNQLLTLITFLIWNFDVAWDLLVVTLLTPHEPHPWLNVMAPRVVRYLILLPVMVACYLASLHMPRWVRNPWMALLGRLALGYLFAMAVHPLLFVGRYLVTGDFNSSHTHYASLLEASLSATALPYVLINLIIYLLGLFIIMGVNARLDLEQERLRAADLQARWLNARLDTLRGQLNPHFLFNSLHTISSLLFSDIRRADKLLADFSDVLRISLREGQREFCAVREELDYCRRYLSIEETRFEDRLTVQIEMDEASAPARVPSLILQPLVENAIKHGIAHSSGRNRVAVSARSSGATLTLEVSNDFRAGSGVGADKKMGIGLTNVRERLAAIYGGGFTLSSRALPGQRWSTLISIPHERGTQARLSAGERAA